MSPRREITIFDKVLASANLLVEVRDARLPDASAASPLPRRFQDKDRVVFLNKVDRASADRTREWIGRLEADGETVIAASALKLGSALSKLESLLSRRAAARLGRGLVRAAIVGLPNVGKSTLVNALVGVARTRTGDRPGITRGRQWVKLSANVYVLDSPGAVPIADKIERRAPQAAAALALCRILPEGRVEPEDAACWLAGWLRRQESPPRVPGLYAPLADREIPPLEALDELARRQGLLARQGLPDRAAAARRIMVDFAAGRLGRLTLETPLDRIQNASSAVSEAAHP